MASQQGLRELALFAGAGGGILGGKLLGWRTVCAVEIDGYARDVLAARQNDGCLEPFPIWDDVRTFTKRNGACRRHIRSLRKIRHDLIITGGFPCQDISVAGKGAGIDGERSGLWREFARIVREIRPRFVLVENSPALVSRGLGTVLGDLASMGYDARWGVLGAVHAGAPHRRERIWIVVDANGRGYSRDGEKRGGAHIAAARCGGAYACGRWWWATEPNVGRVVDGVAASLDAHGSNAAGDVGRLVGRVPKRTKRITVLGNGQVPACVVMAWEILTAMNED